MGAEATNLDKHRYHEVIMASGDDIDGPSPWKCGGSMWKFVEVFFSWTHNLSWYTRPVMETCPHAPGTTPRPTRAVLGSVVVRGLHISSTVASPKA